MKLQLLFVLHVDLMRKKKHNFFNRCNYDTKRYPSWCDRILYFLKKENFEINIDEESYMSSNITFKSDHALVLLKFSVSLPNLEKEGGYYDKYLKYKQKYLSLQ